MTRKASVIIVGEDHQDTKSLSAIAKIIDRLEPAVIGHELLYADECLDTDTIDERLKDCKPGGLCDPRLNIDIYRMGKKHGAVLIGVDLDRQDESFVKASLKDQFAMRETHMVTMIYQILRRVKSKGQLAVVVVGEAHLRTVESKQLGPASPIARLGLTEDFEVYPTAASFK